MISGLCNCASCTARRKELEKEANKKYEIFSKEVLENEMKSNNDFKISFDFLNKTEEVVESNEPETEPITMESIKPKAVIKEFVYGKTRQYFTETNTTTGEVKNASFTIPERKQKVIHSDNATVVILDDGTKGIAKCHPLDEQSRLTGIKIAYTRAKIKLLQKELKNLTK